MLSPTAGPFGAGGAPCCPVLLGDPPAAASFRGHFNPWVKDETHCWCTIPLQTVSVAMDKEHTWGLSEVPGVPLSTAPSNSGCNSRTLQLVFLQATNREFSAITLNHRSVKIRMNAELTTKTWINATHPHAYFLSRARTAKGLFFCSAGKWALGCCALSIPAPNSAGRWV